MYIPSFSVPDIYLLFTESKFRVEKCAVMLEYISMLKLLFRDKF